MKVRILLSHKDWKVSHTGKGKFVRSLIAELKSQGIEVTNNLDTQVDIDFQIARFHYKPRNCYKVVLRMGPAHFDKRKDCKTLNKGKVDAIKTADGVVYQSKFGKKLCDRFICRAPGRVAIINNGADTSDYLAAKKAVSPYTYNFLAACRLWQKQKRLKDVIKSFIMADIEHSALWVAGKVDKEIKEKYNYKNVYFIGLLDDRQLGRYYRLADALIHLVWLDCMPNTVCEALAAQCYVICNNAGGAKEVVEACGGNVLGVDPKFNFKLVDTNKPPKVKRELVAQAIKDSIFQKIEDNKTVNIRHIARDYIEFFKEVLSG